MRHYAHYECEKEGGNSLNTSEADEVLALFLAAFPGVELTDPTMQLWLSVLARFPAEVAQEAALQLLESRHPAKQGRFPTVDEFVPVADRVWQNRQVEQRAAQTHDELEDRTNGRRLLSGPIEAWGEPESLPAKSIRLIRDLCDGLVKPGSEEHQRRPAEIEAMAKGGPDPCCDRDGLVSYTIRKMGRDYSYTARCACPRGKSSQYQSFPTYDARVGCAK